MKCYFKKKNKRNMYSKANYSILGFEKGEVILFLRNSSQLRIRSKMLVGLV